jgi:hypothetical protein
VPAWGTTNDLRGTVACFAPADYRVAVYIYTSGWWNKPTWDSRLTPIGADGTWSCDITTGTGDSLATRIAAFLVPAGYIPPRMDGGATLPAELTQNAVDSLIVQREPILRQITFSGYTWNVKTSEGTVGPGPNYFSDEASDVWVDAQGRLHLRVVQHSGRWYCTEVYTTVPLGYGSYTFQLASRVDQLDPNVVLGLFTWDDDAPTYNYREIDIEFGRWGSATNDDGQFVVQPWTTASNMHRFDLAQSDASVNSTHGFTWRANSIYFQSLNGHQTFPGPALGEVASWTYTGSDLPPAGNAHVRLNLWLLDGDAPTNGQTAEVIISGFTFTP